MTTEIFINDKNVGTMVTENFDDTDATPHIQEVYDKPVRYLSLML